MKRATSSLSLPPIALIERRPSIGLAAFVIASLAWGTACGGTAPVEEPTSPGNPQLPATPQPVVVATVLIPPNYGIHDTFVRDGIAFVCAWNTGLMLYDVGQGLKGGSPSNPVEISRIVTKTAAGIPPGARVHNAWWFHNPVTSEKRYVFVGEEGPAVIGASSTGDIHVVDVSDLTKPVEVAFYHMSETTAAGTHNFWMDEAAQILYAAYYNGGVLALDVSGTLAGDLASREIARVKPAPSGTFVWGVQLAGGSVYALDMLNGFYQLRLTGTTLSVLAGGANVPERFSSELWVHGSVAYTGTWGTRAGQPGDAVKVWRLSAGGAPTLADSILVGNIGTVSDVEVSADGKMLIFSSENGTGQGLHFYGRSNPEKPSLIAHLPVNGGVHTATLAEIGGKKYVFAARNPGPTSDPTPPALVIVDYTPIVP